MVINKDTGLRYLLEEKGVPVETAEFSDFESDWESVLIREYHVDTWINDRLDTTLSHARGVKKNNISLVTFDDKGEGAKLSDLHIAGLVFERENELNGRHVLTGTNVLVLSPLIDKYRRLRTGLNRVIVSMGGSDTYGLTWMILDILEELEVAATIHTGPAFKDLPRLKRRCAGKYKLIHSVPSLCETFFQYDLAFTGGGITPFEANAAGLPCLMISSEEHEISACRFLESSGASIYLGGRESLSRSVVKKTLAAVNIKDMSRAGMKTVTTDGAANIWNALQDLKHE